MQITLVQFHYGTTLPASAVYLAAALKTGKIEHDLKLFDVYRFYNAGRPITMLTSFLADSKEIIAVGCFSDMLPYVLMALKSIKEKWPRKIVILGGIGPTTVASEILDAFDFVDFIVKGAGTCVLPRLIKKISEKTIDLSDLPTVHTRDTRNNRGIRSDNLASDFSGITPDYRIQNIQLFDKFLIQTSWGCPYQCTFCYARPAVDRKITYRNMDEVLNEIKTIKRQRGGKFILRIIDEAFILNRNRVIEFCGHLEKEKLDLEWICYGRVNCVDEKLLRSMFNAGCREIYYGIESGSDRVLKRIRKGFSIEDAMNTLMMTRKIIPHVVASFIYRYPFEMPRDFIDTLVAIRYLHVKNISTQLHPLVPVKDSEIYLRYKNKLRFSLEEPCDYMLQGSLGEMPSESRDFILKYLDVFYDYGYYESAGLVKIDQMLRNNRKWVYSHVATLW